MSSYPCGRKVSYQSKDEALISLAGMWKRPDKVWRRYLRFGKIPRRAYECNWCGAWHLTSRSEFEQAVA